MSNELCHYGRKGMKWYQNIFSKAGRNKSSSSSQKTEDTPDTTKKHVKSKRKSIKDMTDEELSAKIRRLEMEKRYKDLTSDPTSINKGQKFVKEYAGKIATQVIMDNAVDIGKQIAKHYGVQFANQKINKTKRVLNQETGKWEDVLEEVVFTNNKKK